MIAVAIPMSPRASSSSTIAPVTAERSSAMPSSSAGTPTRWSPTSAAAVRTSAGTARSASAVAAAGRMISSASSRATPWIICWSSVGVRSKSGFGFAVAARAGSPEPCFLVKARPAAVCALKPVTAPL